MNRIGFGALFISEGWDAAVTPARAEAALGAVSPGFAAVQLRAHALSGRELLTAAAELAVIARRHHAPLLINDRVDVALAAEADGVHLPAHGLPPGLARKLLGRERLVGVSTHCREEAVRAQEQGADYVVFGPVFYTPSKAQYGAPLGLDALADVARAVAIPVFALGGVDAERARACADRGARVACIGAVLGREDAASGARSLEDALKRR